MTDISELFARDPLQLSKQDLAQIVERFRAQRGQFNLGDKKAGSTKPPTEKAKKLIDLGDKLNIELDL